MFLAGTTLALSFTCHAQMDFHTNVTNLWYQGEKSNVLEIAEHRLTANTNDIAGLVLKFDFEVEFLEFPSISNTAHRALAVGETIVSANFKREFPEYKDGIEALLYALPFYPPNEIAADKLKALIPHKPLNASKVIKALQDDGYFQ